MTTKAVNYWTHDVGAGPMPHLWAYQGRKAQAYRCVVCQLRVSKADLKGETDA